MAMPRARPMLPRSASLIACYPSSTMVETITVPRKPRRQNLKSRKIDNEKVLALHKQGMNMSDIAQHQGVHHSTIWRFLERVQAEKVKLQVFKDGRADALALLHADSVNILELGMKHLEKDMAEDGIFAAQSPSAKAGILRDMSVVNGVLFDKERLERGQSTSNVSVIERMLDTAHDTVFKDQGMGTGMVKADKPAQVIDVTSQSEPAGQSTRPSQDEESDGK